MYHSSLDCFGQSTLFQYQRQELRKAVDTFQMTPAQVKRVVMAGFQAAFYPGDFRTHREYVRKAEAMYAAVEAKHGVQSY